MPCRYETEDEARSITLTRDLRSQAALVVSVAENLLAWGDGVTALMCGSCYRHGELRNEGEPQPQARMDA